MTTQEHPPPAELGAHLIAAAQSDTSWVVRLHDDTERTLTTAEIVEAYNERLIDPATYVWTNGMQTWQQLQAVDALVDALHAEADRTAEPAPPETTENSAMFSLAMLTSQSHPDGGDAVTDDSGLIDLAALTAAHGEQAPAPEPVPLPDLFHPAAPAPAPAVPPAATPSASNRGIVIALASAIVVLSAALAFFIVRDSAAPVESPSANVEEAKPAERPDPTIAAPEPVPETVASVTPPAPSASAPGSAAPAPTPFAQRSTARIPAAKTAKPTGRLPAGKKQPAPSPGCNCGAEDLQCQMRCAVKR